MSHTLVALMLVVLLGIVWALVRRHPERGRFVGAIGFLVFALALETLVPWLAAEGMGPKVLRAVAHLTFLFGLVRALAVASDLWAMGHTRGFSTIFRELLTLLVYGIVVLVVARTELDVDVTPLLATSALVTAVVGLALQETLGNVFSGLSLQMQKPFEIGDWVRFQSYLGRVQGIGWRSTRLLTRQLEALEVPNALLAREVITNYRGTAMGDDLFVGVAYRVPPNQVKEVILRILRTHREIAKSPEPQVWLADYGDFAIRYRIRFWMLDYSQQDFVRDEILTAVWYAFRRSGIEIPFPIRTLHVERVNRRGGEADVRERIRAALQQVDFLKELSEEELSVLVPNLREEDYGRGDVICREGQEGDTFYVLRSGTAEVLATGPAGDQTHIADLRPPAFFGEMSLLTGEARSATVRAKEDVKLLVVEREGFERLFASRPSIAEAISRVIAVRQSELRERRQRSAAGESVDSQSQRLLSKMRAIFRF